MSRRWGALIGAASLILLLAPAAPAGLRVGDPGDANCDGELKHDDLRRLIATLYGRPGPDECAGSDVNGDDRISVADVVAILQPIANHATRSIVVFLMGDGMGPEHVRAGAASRGAPLGFTEFPVVVPGFDTSSLTTLATGEATDSAAGATAFATGVRVLNGEVSRTAGMDLVTAGELAAGAGKSVGIVTNGFLFDASPAAFIAHSTRREQLGPIAEQYLAFAPEVLMGAAPNPIAFPRLEEFLARARARGYTVVRSAAELESLDLGGVRRLLAVFSVDFDLGFSPIARFLFPIHGTPRLLRGPEAIDPPLARLAQVAVTLLARNPFGFFLFVENENIDTLSHAGGFAAEATAPLGAVVAGEVVELAAATEGVIDTLAAAGRHADALVVVTADHETGGFTFPDDDPAAGSFPAAPNHTTQPVPLYATGQGAERFASVQLNIDVFSAMRPALR